MNLINAFRDFFKRKSTILPRLSPNGFCPICWGKKEYGGRFQQKIKQENLDIFSLDSNVGWVKDYVNKHLSGIVLKRRENGKSLICGTCKSSYQYSD